MYLAYKKDDIYVKIVACLFISCFIVMCFIGSVFASYEITVINPITNQTANLVLPDWVEKDDMSYFFMFKQNSNTDFSYLLFYFEKNANVTFTKSGTYLISNGPVYIYTFGSRTDWAGFVGELSSIKNQVKPNVTNGTRYLNPVFIDYNNYYTNVDIKDSSGNVIFKNNSIKFPQITTSLEDLQTLNFDTISVSANSWSDKDLYILFYDRSLMNNEDTQGLYPKKEIKLTKDTSYYIPEISSEQNAIYWVANDNTGLNFKVGGKYEIRLAERVPQSTGRWLSW